MIYRYNEKKETEAPTDKIIKRNYVEARGHNWSVSNKRPIKLRDSLKCFEVSNLIYGSVAYPSNFMSIPLIKPWKC